MFGSFRGKLQSVQDGITSSLQRISSGDSPQKIPQSYTVNLNAGAKLLQQYQLEWHDGHALAADNARKAEAIDAVIGEVDKNLEKQWTRVNEMTAAVGSIPRLITATRSLMGKLAELQELFDDVQHHLLQLEDIVETQKLQERQLEHRFQLTLYRKKKLLELDRIHETLAANYTDKVQQYESKRHQCLKERESAFQQAFNDDLVQYKQSGILPGNNKIVNHKAELSLEEVTLEEDTAELNQFLNEEPS